MFSYNSDYNAQVYKKKFILEMLKSPTTPFSIFKNPTISKILPAGKCSKLHPKCQAHISRQFLIR